jgi:hypothetical protein
MSNNEYSFFMVESESTYECVLCFAAMRAFRDENTPIRNSRSASTLQLPKKIASPEREHILSDLKDPESLTVQIKTVRLNAANTHSLVENLIRMVLKLS